MRGARRAGGAAVAASGDPFDHRELHQGDSLQERQGRPGDFDCRRVGDAVARAVAE